MTIAGKSSGSTGSDGAILAVLVSSILFGASTPLARALVGAMDPLWLAGALYAGSGAGLSSAGGGSPGAMVLRAYRHVTGVA